MDGVELGLDLGLVARDEGHLLALALALLLVLDGADDAQRGTARTHHVLVRYREQVALLPRVKVRLRVRVRVRVG